MSEWLIRKAGPEDRPALEHILSTCFGDTPAEAEAFFSFLRAQEDVSLAAAADGQTAGSIFLLSGIRLLCPGSRDYSCTYLFALGVLPEFRGRGMGMALYRKACSMAQETADCVSILPAEESLRKKYHSILPLTVLCRVREAAFSREELPDRSGLPVCRLTPAQYGTEREILLEGRPHAVFPARFYPLMETYGMMFLKAGRALAAAMIRDGVCIVQELLAAQGAGPELIAGIAQACPAASYLVRTPMFFPGPGSGRDWMLQREGTWDAWGMSGEFWYPFSLE